MLGGYIHPRSRPADLGRGHEPAALRDDGIVALSGGILLPGLDPGRPGDGAGAEVDDVAVALGLGGVDVAHRVEAGEGGCEGPARLVGEPEHPARLDDPGPELAARLLEGEMGA